MRWWEGAVYEGETKTTMEEQVFSPWVVGAVLRVDVEFFTL